MTHTVEIKETPGSDELFMEVPDDIIQALSLKEGDTLIWTVREDGSVALSKAEKQLVLVETISTFRLRYLVEVPSGQTEGALDTVVMEEAKEASQKWLGETIVSHRVVTREEAQRAYSEDNVEAGWIDLDRVITKLESEDEGA